MKVQITTFYCESNDKIKKLRGKFCKSQVLGIAFLNVFAKGMVCGLRVASCGLLGKEKGTGNRAKELEKLVKSGKSDVRCPKIEVLK